MQEKEIIEPFIARTWKRDGTVNYMDLEAAVLNLLTRSQHYSYTTVFERRRKIRQALLDGQTLETELAKFKRF